MRNSDPDDERRTVIDRAIIIVECVAAATGEVGLTAIAEQTGLKKTTVHRLCTELTSNRVLEKGPRGYRVGLRLFELGQRVPTSRRLRAAALPLMADLLEASHEVVQLGVLDRNDVVYLEKLSGLRSVRAPSEVGARWPAYCTALGKAILAFTPQAQVDAILSEPMHAYTAHTITQPSRLRDELRAIRRTGVAHDREEGTRGLVCVAAPILVDTNSDEGGRTAVAALSVSGSVHRLQPLRFEAAVRTAALTVSRLLNPARPMPASWSTRVQIAGRPTKATARRPS